MTGATTKDDARAARARPGPIDHPLILGAAHAVLAALAFPPIALWPIALLAVVPLVRAASVHAHRARWAGAWTAAGTLPLWLFSLVWCVEMTPAGYVPMAAAMALFGGMTVFVAARAHGRLRLPMVVAAPVAWVGVEVLRGEVLFTGFPWMLAGMPLIDGPWPLRAAAGLAGVYGVSMVAVLAGAGLAELIARRWWAGVAGLAASGALAGAGVLAWPAAGEGRSVTFAVVQTDVSQNKAMLDPSDRASMFEGAVGLTHEAAAQGARVIVWPETMFPGLALDEASARVEEDAGLEIHFDLPGWPSAAPSTVFREALLALQERIGASLVIGALRFEGLRLSTDDAGRVRVAFDARFNSALVVEGGRVSERAYDKIALTPFGEVIPYVWRWRALSRAIESLGPEGLAFDLSPGTSVEPIEAHAAGAAVRMATPICFEAAKPRLCRELVFGPGGRRADVLVNLTNDGWFGRFEMGRQQHLLAARWRCVELATPMVRAANTGISAFVDARGRVTQTTALWTDKPTGREGLLIGVVALADSGTLLARWGYVPAWTCLALTGGMLAASAGRSRQGRERRAAG